LGDQGVKKIKESGVGIYDFKFADYLKKEESWEILKSNEKLLEEKCKDYLQAQS